MLVPHRTASLAIAGDTLSAEYNTCSGRTCWNMSKKKEGKEIYTRLENPRPNTAGNHAI
jgi:hypothetical protein